MSRVVKASNVHLDKDNTVFIEALDSELLDSYDDAYMEEVEDIAAPSEEEEAQGILDLAHAQADEILAQANMEAERIIAEGVKDGEEQKAEVTEAARQAGYNAGYAQSVSEAADIKEEALKIKADAEAFRQQQIASLEPDLIQLISDIVEKLLTDEVEINPGVILALIKQGLRQASLTGDVNVHVSKEDFETVQARKEEILASLDTMAKIEFVEDVTLEKAQCIIETSFGSINCSLNSQFEALKKNLFYILKNR